MATVINNPGDNSRGEGSGVGVIVGIIIALLIIVLFFVYALPAIRNNDAGAGNGGIDVNVDLPGGGASGGGTSSPVTTP